jgi:hypothetical protein
MFCHRINQVDGEGAFLVLMDFYIAHIPSGVLSADGIGSVSIFHVGLLKKAASSVTCLRRASFAEVATKAESGFVQAGRHFPVLTYSAYAPRFKPTPPK